MERSDEINGTSPHKELSVDGQTCETVRSVPSRNLEFCEALSRELHDLRNLLWPVTVRADCALSGTDLPELTNHMKRIGENIQEALTIATRMSELVERHLDGSPAGVTKREVLDARRAPPTPASRLRILCVNHDSNVRGLLGNLLSHLGHEVDLSTSGSEARQLFAAHTYDVVLSDMNGREITGTIRDLGTTPVIWLAGADVAASGNIPDAPDGPNYILIKPLSLSALREALQQVSASGGSKSIPVTSG